MISHFAGLKFGPPRRKEFSWRPRGTFPATRDETSRNSYNAFFSLEAQSIFLQGPEPLLSERKGNFSVPLMVSTSVFFRQWAPRGLLQKWLS